VVLVLAGLLTGSAHARAICMETARLRASLIERFAEELLWSGVVGEGEILIELWGSERGEHTWTLIAIDPKSRNACAISTGKGWHLAGPPEKKS
jgi:hypothetical protein